MNRRSRRRAVRAGARRPSTQRRPLPPAWRAILLLAGAALVMLGVALAAHGSTARGGRVVGAIVIGGAVLVVLAWLGRW